MQNQTITRAAESDLEPDAIYDILADVSYLPRWAPAFADSIESVDDTHFRVTKSGSSFGMELLLNRAAGTVDYVRETANNRRAGAYLRVTPRPLGGSAVAINVPLAPNANESDVTRTLDQELADVIQLAQSQVHAAR